jgi:transposase-like protein
VWDSQYPHGVIRFSLVDSGDGMAVSITRMDLDAPGLRRAAAQSRDSDASRRMLALALVLDGRSRTEAAVLCGMDRQTLRDWVHRYNDLGLAGLSSRRGSASLVIATPVTTAVMIASSIMQRPMTAAMLSPIRCAAFPPKNCRHLH